MQLLKTCFLGFSLLFGAYANAAVVTFDFSGPGGNQLYPDLEFNAGGYTLLVTAKAFYTDENGRRPVNALVEQFTAGLGVRSDFDTNNRLDDTDSLEEELMFKLSSDIDPSADFTWMEIVFGGTHASRLEAGDGAQIRFQHPEEARFISGPVASFETQLTDPSTWINVQSTGSESDNGFRIQQISIDVPEPTTMALLSLGILGLSARRLVNKR